MPYYSDELVEEVRSANDIVDVISGYVRLQKKGSTYFGLCPFHNEKTPSFSVSPGKQMYYCFGCGAGGNVLTFLMQYENYTFPEAMEALADRAGIEAAQAGNGTIGDIGCYSFNGNKIITTGAGGAVVSNHPDWAEHAKHLSTQAKADMLQFLHDEVGYNYRMTNVQACLGLAQLERLEGFIAHKKELYDHYVAALDGVKGLRILPFREEECRSNHWFFSLYLKDSGLERDTVIEKLQAEKNPRPARSGRSSMSRPTTPRNEAYALDKAEDYRKYIVNLPCSTNLSIEDCERVCQAVLAL